MTVTLLLLGFDGVKDEIALNESSGGKYKIHVNANRTIDCGIYQINSVHFSGRGRVAKEFNLIFQKWGIGCKLHERVVASIVNDSLNEDLARKLYEIRGLRAWSMTWDMTRGRLQSTDRSKERVFQRGYR